MASVWGKAWGLAFGAAWGTVIDVKVEVPRGIMPAREVIPRRLHGINKLRDDDAMIILML